MSIDRDTRIFVSVAAAPGNFGATIYNYLFHEMGINAVYLPRKAKTAEELIAAIRTLDLAGCSVSMPLKSAVPPLLDELDPLAKRIGAVNTIKNDGRALTGFNTDCHGCIRALDGLACGAALIYGYGAVARSVVVALQSMGAGRIEVTGRDPAKAGVFAREMGVEPHRGGGDFNLLINATPSSVDPEAEVGQLLDVAPVVFDLVVSPDPTPLLERAQRMGKTTVAGIEMSLYQLMQQFEIYTGLAPDEALARKALGDYLKPPAGE